MMNLVGSKRLYTMLLIGAALLSSFFTGCGETHKPSQLGTHSGLYPFFAMPMPEDVEQWRMGLINNSGEVVVEPNFQNVIFAGEIDQELFYLAQKTDDSWWLVNADQEKLVYDGDDRCLLAHYFGDQLFQLICESATEKRDNGFPLRYVRYLDLKEQFNLPEGYRSPVPDTHPDRFVFDRDNLNVDLIPIFHIESECCGFANRNGQVVIEPQFKFAYPFYGDYAIVTTQDATDEAARPNAVIDTNARVVLKFDDKLQQIESHFVSSGMVKVRDQATEQVSFVNLQGEVQQGAEFESFSPYSQGLAAAKDAENGLLGFVNREGKFQVPPKYENLTVFAEERAWGHTKDGIELIDPSGKVIKQFRQKLTPRPFRGGLAAIERYQQQPVADKSGYIDSRLVEQMYVDRNGDLAWKTP